ncbi:C40 family peptidase [Ichthyobacterium seriolicida]|nr:NlpC/P60 family protein [Ichthyobacterium seriolicida]
MDEKSELVTQLLFGEHFKILEKKDKWCLIHNPFDDCEGYINSKQFSEIDYSLFEKLEKTPAAININTIASISNNEEMHAIPMGASLPFLTRDMLTFDKNVYRFYGESSFGEFNANSIKNIAFLYLNSPKMLGGKTVFGIDNSGFVQMVYKMCGKRISKNIASQIDKGESINFIKDTKIGDLVFFHKKNVIDHIGIILSNKTVIHVTEKVCIDTIDHLGIYNKELKKYSHNLKVIKRIL